MNTLPDDLRGLPALSIRPLWAHSIIHLGKDIENRSWGTKFRGSFLIHASLGGGSKKVQADEFNLWARCAGRTSEGTMNFYKLNQLACRDGKIVAGGIIGVAELVDCVHDRGEPHPVEVCNPWWIGPYGFILRNVSPVNFVPCRGALGFFKPQIESR